MSAFRATSFWEALAKESWRGNEAIRDEFPQPVPSPRHSNGSGKARVEHWAADLEQIANELDGESYEAANLRDIVEEMRRYLLE